MSYIDKFYKSNNYYQINKQLTSLLSYLKQTGLHDEGVRVCLAGGSVRDSLLGHTPKDLDFFFYSTNPSCTVDEMDDNIVYLTSFAKIEVYEKGSSTYDKKDFTVYSNELVLERDVGFPCDFIVGEHTMKKGPSEIVESFNMALNKVWYCPYTNQVGMPPETKEIYETGIMESGSIDIEKYYDLVKRVNNEEVSFKTYSYPIKIKLSKEEVLKIEKGEKFGKSPYASALPQLFVK